VSELERTLRLDAEFFRKAHRHAADAARSHRHEDVSSIAAVSDGNHFTISADFVDEGIPYYRGQDVVGNFFIEQAAPNFITEEAYNRPYMARSHLKKGDVLLSIIGTIGELSLVASQDPATCSCKLAILRPHSIRPEFLAVALRSRIGRLQIERLTRGAVQMGLILEDMDQLLVPRLGLALENRIADLIVAAKRAREASTDGLRQAEETLARKMGLSPVVPAEPLSYVQSAGFVSAAGRLDSQYFMPAKTETITVLAALQGSPLGETFESVRDVVDPTKHGSLGLVRNFDVTHALEPILDDEREPIDFADVGSTKKRMKRGDVAISRLRSYLKEIAIVGCSNTYPTVGSTEFIVLRPREKSCPIAPPTLLTFLRSQPVQTILKWCQDGSQHPRFSEKDLLSIPLPDAVAAASPCIEALVDDALSARDQERKLIAAAKRAVEIAAEESDGAATRFLDDMET
jgi:type I restriction enzyme M protein